MKTVLLFVGLVVVGINLISLFFNANTFRPMIEKRLTTTLGRSVKLGELSLSLFSGGLVAKDLSVADDPSFSATPFLTAKELRIGVSLRQLILSRQVNLRSLQIESPQFTAIRATNGTWNFSSIGALIPSTGTASENPKGSTPELDYLSVGGIIVEDGRVLIANLPAHGESRLYDHVNLTARNFSLASRFPFELSANLPASGSISVTGHMGPINRDEAAATPGEAHITVKRLNPGAAGFLDQSAGLSFLGDIDMHAASDGQTITTRGTADIQHLRLRKGAAIVLKPLDLAYSGTYRLKENSGQWSQTGV
jgi:AsmA protein